MTAWREPHNPIERERENLRIQGEAEAWEGEQDRLDREREFEDSLLDAIHRAPDDDSNPYPLDER